MNAETKLLILAAIVTVGGMWCAYLMRGKTDTLPPPSKDVKRNGPESL